MLFNYMMGILVLLGISCLQSDHKAFSKASCDTLKVLMTIVVFLHHLSQILVEVKALQVFRSAGTFAVATFFMISGYGLMYSYRKYQKVGNDYLRWFIPRRLGGLVGPFMLVYIIYFFYNGFIQGEWYIFSLQKLFLKGEYLVPFSWYFFAILYFYICFYITAKICKSQGRIVITMFALTILYFLWTRNHGFGGHWYYACFAFPIGIWIGSKQGRLFTFFTHKCYFISMVVLYTIYFVLTEIEALRALDDVIKVPFIGITLALCVIVGIQKFTFHPKRMQCISKFTYCAFLIQGFSIGILRNTYFYMQSSFLYFLCVIALNFLLGYVIYRLYQFLIPYITATWQHCKIQLYKKNDTA